MGRASETSDEKDAIGTHVFVTVKEVDTAAELASGEQGVLDPEEALRVRFVARFQALTESDIILYLCRRKIDKHILPLMCSKSNFNVDNGCVLNFILVLYWCDNSTLLPQCMP